MESEHKTFEITVGGREIVLELGHCAVALFRRQQEVSYIAVDLGPDEDGEDRTLRIFNNQQFAEWVAGRRLTVDTDNVLHHQVAREDFNGSRMTFRELTGWNPVVIEREEPNDLEKEMWTEINTADMEDGLKELLGE